MAEAVSRRAGVPLLGHPQAATCRPQDSQYLLSGLRAAAQPAHADDVSRRPQLEQKSASDSGRGPQRAQDGTDSGVTVGAFEDVAAEARRSALTLAETMASIWSKAAAASS
jgi:hypothetical protein